MRTSTFLWNSSNCVNFTHLSMSSPSWGGGGGVGHRVGTLTKSKIKNIVKIPTPKQKIIAKIRRNTWFTSHLHLLWNWQIKCMMWGQNPHSGDMCQSEIPVCCPIRPPPPPSGLTLIGALLLKEAENQLRCTLGFQKTSKDHGISAKASLISKEKMQVTLTLRVYR